MADPTSCYFSTTSVRVCPTVGPAGEAAEHPDDLAADLCTADALRARQHAGFALGLAFWLAAMLKFAWEAWKGPDKAQKSKAAACWVLVLGEIAGLTLGCIDFRCDAPGLEPDYALVQGVLSLAGSLGLCVWETLRAWWQLQAERRKKSKAKEKKIAQKGRRRANRTGEMEAGGPAAQ